MAHPIADSEDFPIEPCIHCGFCCMQTPCGFGEWNSTKTQCQFLDAQDDGTYLCGKYDDIVKDPTADIVPAAKLQ